MVEKVFKWRFFLRTKNGKKFNEQSFANLSDLNVAKRKAITDEVFLSVGTFLD